MKMSPRRRVLVACFISLIVNIIWFVLDASTIPTSYPPSRADKIVNLLGSPGGKFADWLAPLGHDIAHVLGGFLLAIGFSFVFYATLAWVIISLPVWWRERT
jgi:hypothetical protein